MAYRSIFHPGGNQGLVPELIALVQSAIANLTPTEGDWILVVAQDSQHAHTIEHVSESRVRTVSRMTGVAAFCLSGGLHTYDDAAALLPPKLRLATKRPWNHPRGTKPLLVVTDEVRFFSILPPDPVLAKFHKDKS